jgi:hypothetical protein
MQLFGMMTDRLSRILSGINWPKMVAFIFAGAEPLRRDCGLARKTSATRRNLSFLEELQLEAAHGD